MTFARSSVRQLVTVRLEESSLSSLPTLLLPCTCALAESDVSRLLTVAFPSTITLLSSCALSAALVRLPVVILLSPPTVSETTPYPLCVEMAFPFSEWISALPETLITAPLYA